MNFFFLALEILGLIITLFVLVLIQLISLIEERKNPTKTRIQKLIVFSILFLLTLFHSFTNRLIEKVDWLILENKRIEIVEQVKSKELIPNVARNGIVCELPFKFPVVSNGGNDIYIFRNEADSSLTVEFLVFSNFFSNPSTYFIYTEDQQKIDRLEKKINQLPKQNWKIKENWYRIYGEY